MKWMLKLRILFSIGRRAYQTRKTASPVRIKNFLLQYLLGFNKTAYWPVHFSSIVSGVQYIKIGIGTAPGFSHGCYIFAGKDAPVAIGDYTIIAPNVCIAGFNHDSYDYRKFISNGATLIGKYCWLGMNSCILPGVKLGDHTIVAAGSVVTRSFEEGYVIIGGNPAAILKKIESEKCVPYKNEYEYVGYLTLKEFDSMRRHLNYSVENESYK
jgi:acetyltransferase-like isoleucine patch superfamily enzyme